MAGKAKKQTMVRALEQWVTVLPDGILEANEEERPMFVRLPHPKTNQFQQFFVSADKKTVCEVIRFREEPRSFFIDESVHEDGSVYMVTPVDPLFLALPCLSKAAKKTTKFLTLDDIVSEAGRPLAAILMSSISVAQLHNICDVREGSGYCAIRLEDEKVMRWLREKVEQTAKQLEVSRVHVSSGAQAATYVKSRKATQATFEEYCRYAAGLVSSYLATDLSAKLKEVFSADVPVKANELSTDEPPAKRHKPSDANGDAEGVVEDYRIYNTPQPGGGKKPSKMTPAQKKLDKADKSGMKSLSSFFSKGKKKA